MRSTAPLTDALRGRKRAVTFVGAAAALLGAGTASAASVASAAQTPAAANSLSQATTAHTSAAPSLTAAAQHGTGASLAPLSNVPTQATAQLATAGTMASRSPAAKSGQAKSGQAKSGQAESGQAKSGGAQSSGANSAATSKDQSRPQVQATVASQTSSSEPRAADNLLPVATSGPQAWMPVSGSQLANATTIVKQALDKEMGVRSAVIAVATSMQESNLKNVDYGTADSLGLFQQRPSCGWGTQEQIMDPKYAADAFLNALHHYQASDPSWAEQPLWQSAQGVQGSAYPYAYAKWETQAAHLVRQIVNQVR
jgi:hypothetical protein